MDIIAELKDVLNEIRPVLEEVRLQNMYLVVYQLLKKKIGRKRAVTNVSTVRNKLATWKSGIKYDQTVESNCLRKGNGPHIFPGGITEFETAVKSGGFIPRLREISDAFMAPSELRFFEQLVEDNDDALLTEEIPDSESGHYERSLKTVKVNIYERDREARRKCLKHHGYVCKACDTKLSDKYGPIARDFIHVHHVIPLAEIKKEYKVDPIKDLVPVCPSCHSTIHRDKKNPLTIEELRAKIRAQKNPTL